MRSERAHPVKCLVVLAVYLANLAFVASGAVVCRAADSEAQIELACDHDHCPTFAAASHDHDPAGSCDCTACPCEDTPLGSLVTALLNRDDADGRLAGNADLALLHAAAPARTAGQPPCMAWRSPPPRAPAQLGQLRTIVLIV